MSALDNGTLQELAEKLASVLYSKKYVADNLFRYMTDDACMYQHHMLDPENLRRHLPLDTGRHPSLGDKVQQDKTLMTTVEKYLS